MLWGDTSRITGRKLRRRHLVFIKRTYHAMFVLGLLMNKKSLQFVVLAVGVLSIAMLALYRDVTYGINSAASKDPVAQAGASRAAVRETPLAGSVRMDVPFTAQAPLGNWSDPRQQDGCEEASALMAMAWVRGETLSPEDAEKEIIAISEYERARYGTYHDTSAHDTAERIFKGYFDYDNVTVAYDMTADDIREELRRGNLVIVPADGQKLDNPNYTPPGPPVHMLVIIGYEGGRFITNDPGTRAGASYEYKEETLMGAIRDYPTGSHEPIESERRAMIVVSGD